MNHTLVYGGWTDHHQWSCACDIHFFFCSHTYWTGHISKGGKNLAELVLWLRWWGCPLETGEVSTALGWCRWTTGFVLGVFSWLLRSFWACCLKVHWILVLLCIRIWQATASTHGKTPAREPFPSNVGPLPQEESGGLCCSCTMHFLEGNRLFPHLFTDSLTPGLCLCVSLVNILHSNNFFVLVSRK